MSCSKSILVAALACSCAGALEDPARFAVPDAGSVAAESDGGCNPVTDIFPVGCATSACHSAQSAQAGLDLQSPGLPQRLVGKQAHGGPGLIIDAAHPSQSVLLTKLSDTPPFGFQMPLGAQPLSPDELACVQAWVEQ